jgi:transposase
MEKYLPKNVVDKDKSRGVSLMVWACFINHHLSPLVALRGIQNAEGYNTLLKEKLLPFIETLPRRRRAGFIFQQDNALIHTARVNKAWLEEQNFITMEWPPNSPDMSPIEYLWYCLKEGLHSRYPDTATLGGGPERVKQVLEERLSEVWANISQEKLENLIQQMPQRVAELYKAKGWYTRF